MPPKGDRCEFMHYDPKTITWPHVHRCEQLAVGLVHVDGVDMDLCTGHAIEARRIMRDELMQRAADGEFD